MDTSKMNATFLSHNTGILVGQDTAPIKLIELINVRCPFCKKWHEDNNKLLMTLVLEGKLQRCIKLYDKDKPGLDKGNIMHRFISKTDGQLAVEQLTTIYNTQNTWGNFEAFNDISNYAKNDLKLEEDYRKNFSSIIQQEATKANIPFVPTMVINNHIFDQSISHETLLNLLEKQKA
ncbi:DsbA family protein [Vagococcus sp. PNs007]|uniref:DsbA family protein n=1 Tax=Vagococcus proximus TaxID=2991417 RepID=A0ABT5X2T4_9ENTE|nr:thioredoxin domain-containing protein [Vagococcus proximus]MDF0480317.1 DsbA family protein [Vagococcus proximus]